MARPDSPHDAVRITSVAPGRSEDISHRQRNYLIAMAIRVVAFVVAVSLLDGWARWVGVVLAIFLPYVAVVFANGEEQRKEQFDVAGPAGHELPGTRRNEL